MKERIEIVEDNLIVFCQKIAEAAKQGYIIDADLEAPGMFYWSYVTAMFRGSDEEVVGASEGASEAPKRGRPAKEAV